LQAEDHISFIAYTKLSSFKHKYNSRVRNKTIPKAELTIPKEDKFKDYFLQKIKIQRAQTKKITNTFL
jgi:hypothetical protein